MGYLVINFQFKLLFNDTTMSDFLSWDQDIDLDLLLGEYTEYDPEPSDSDEECYIAKKKKSESVPDTCIKPSYSCPVCKKTLKTISGSRGHVKKQHGPNLRASDHRTHADSKLPNTVRDALNESLFAEIFPTALQSSLSNIANDPFTINNITMTAVQKSTSNQEKLTENDQSIILLVTPFVPSKRDTPDNSSGVNFVKQYDKWYKTQDRGGLQKPSDSLFLLIRELETIIRKTVEPSYSASSLLIDPVKEAMMEGFMVKHYCDILI
ncbi:uncharacterized protein [Mytilus edulis]|uniref:uncharacterized protein n=1 Tax=Mytilus edulis TaxID=6550 RepID=UPI0039F0C706